MKLPVIFPMIFPMKVPVKVSVNVPVKFWLNSYYNHAKFLSNPVKFLLRPF